jgi:hypothetical protein
MSTTTFARSVLATFDKQIDCNSDPPFVNEIELRLLRIGGSPKAETAGFRAATGPLLRSGDPARAVYPGG